MSKLTLNFDDLQVETFVTTPENAAHSHGTIEAYSGATNQIEITNCVLGCQDSITCTDSVSACQCETCYNNAGCGSTAPCSVC